MTESASWGLLREVMAQHAPIRFWLRDDDAVEPGVALDRLLHLTAKFYVPVALAVIPAFADEALGQRLKEMPHATPVIHGWSHQNHALGGEKKCELKNSPTIQRDLTQSLARMEQLFGKTLLPMLVPPWNRIDDLLLPHLASLGFTALSAFGVKPRGASVPIVNTHIDIMDWRGPRGSRSHAALIAEIVDRIKISAEPIGLLTHHLVHDEGAWEFLEQIFQATGGQWMRAGDLIAHDR